MERKLTWGCAKIMISLSCFHINMKKNSRNITEQPCRSHLFFSFFFFCCCTLSLLKFPLHTLVGTYQEAAASGALRFVQVPCCRKGRNGDQRRHTYSVSHMMPLEKNSQQVGMVQGHRCGMNDSRLRNLDGFSGDTARLRVRPRPLILG